jgi:hypothetical protein
LPADAARVVAIAGLIVVVHVAVVEVHVPGVGGIVLVGSGRPIVVGNSFLLLPSSILRRPEFL